MTLSFGTDNALSYRRKVKRMKKRTLILIPLIIVIAISFGGCYTQLKLTKPTKKATTDWAEENCNRHNCGSNSRWDFYYNYPWWFDQNWWWEKYSDENQTQLEQRRVRYERRRDFGGVLDGAINVIETIRNGNHNTNSGDSDSDGQSNPPKEKKERRRGLE